MTSSSYLASLHEGSGAGSGTVVQLHLGVDGRLPDCLFEPIDTNGAKVPGKWDLESQNDLDHVAQYVLDAG